MKSLRFKMASSKFFMAMVIIVMTNLIMWVPMAVNMATGTAIALMTGSEYTSLMIGIFGIYCGLNVMQKQVFAKLGLADPDSEPQEETPKKKKKEDMTAE